MQPLGTIVRLQVQASSLKVGGTPRRYDPLPIRSVPALRLSAGGVTGLMEDGTAIVDVHHRDHPASKNVDGVNGVSLGFTTHYAAMRERFGEHIVHGVAGENVLIETDRALQEEDLATGILIETADGTRVALRSLLVAAPCVEFTRFALRFPDGQKPDRTVTEALRFLHDGMRGFYASVEGETAVIRVGDRVFLA